jgi:uncharacterized hydrophobic protein (TIGR00271 family)
MERTLRERIEGLLRISPDAKPRVYENVFHSSDFTSLSYILELVFSAGIATLGLVLNSPAVVIGAMLISPLMGPIMGAGLGLAASDVYLSAKSVAGLLASILTAILFSSTLVWLLPFHVATSEILARTQPNLLDLGVALLSGLAGSVVVCRGGEGGGITAMPGVAIAVALMPPLCTVGYGVGSGFDTAIMAGAGLLFLTNLVAITASSFVVFYVVRMDSPDVREPIHTALEQAASKRWIDKALGHTLLAGRLGDIGKLRYRFLMLAALFVLLFVPLQRSFEKMRDEALTAAAIREGLRRLAPEGALIKEAVDTSSGSIGLQLVAATEVPEEKVADVRDYLMRRTGKSVTLNVRRVASADELRLLRETLASRSRPQQADPLRDLDTVNGEILMRAEKVVAEVWPAETAPRENVEVILEAAGPKIRIRYSAGRELDAAAIETITKAVRTRLGNKGIRLECVRQAPAKSGRAKR